MKFELKSCNTFRGNKKGFDIAKDRDKGRSVQTSELQSEYFSRLTMKSVNKCLVYSVLCTLLSIY